MKVKVTKKFVDKYNKTLYEVGDTIDLTKERYQEIQSVGDFVKKVRTVTPDKEEVENG